MKQRLIDKLLTALCGAILFLIALIVFIWCIGFVPQSWASALSDISVQMITRVIIAVGSLLVMILSAYCFVKPFKRGRDFRSFIEQKTDNGQMKISLRAMENLVQRCIEQHEELHIIGSHISANREGVVVNLRVGLANGVSIPLAVNDLQKRIKQYIQACSGVDVKEVCVQVETANSKIEDSPFMVHDVLVKADENAYTSEYVSDKDPLLMDQPQAIPQDANILEVSTNENTARIIPEKVEPRKHKPLHQRLFKQNTHADFVQGPPISAEEESEEAEPDETLVEEAEHE
jgi:uncharacterized alkaline shock family protein YloU